MTDALAIRDERIEQITLNVEKALHLLQVANSFDEVRQIKVQAKMLEAALRDLDASRESVNVATRLVTRAEIRMGALTAAMPGVPNDGSRNGSVPTLGVDKKTAALTEAGLSTQRVSEAEVCAKNPELTEAAMAEVEAEGRRPTLRNVSEKVSEKLPPKKKAPPRPEELAAKTPNKIEVRMLGGGEKLMTPSQLAAYIKSVEAYLDYLRETAGLE